MFQWILLGLIGATVVPWVYFAINHGYKESVLLQKIIAMKPDNGYPYNSGAKGGGH